MTLAVGRVFSVDNPTLNRFFALHYLLPFVLVGVIFLHIAALHITGSNNPLGIDVKSPQDTLPFHPYYTIKDSVGVCVYPAGVRHRSCSSFRTTWATTATTSSRPIRCKRPPTSFRNGTSCHTNAILRSVPNKLLRRDA